MTAWLAPTESGPVSQIPKLVLWGGEKRALPLWSLSDWKEKWRRDARSRARVLDRRWTGRRVLRQLCAQQCLRPRSSLHQPAAPLPGGYSILTLWAPVSPSPPHDLDSLLFRGCSRNHLLRDIITSSATISALCPLSHHPNVPCNRPQTPLP